MKKNRLIALTMRLFCACAAGPQLMVPADPLGASPLPFAKALSSRTLDPRLPAQTTGGQPVSSLISPFFGSSEFSTYVPVMAEESLLPGNSGELGSVFSQTIQPLLDQWDRTARLTESRGNTRPELQDPNSVEYIYVPGLDPSQLQPLLPDWVFRFASTSRKETLTVYVTGKATRVYRVIWSEPDIAIARVRLSVQQAVERARKAIADKSSQPGYPVYPQPGDLLGSQATVVYDLPEQLNWRVSLGQQGNQLIYYLNTSYAEASGQPGAVVRNPSGATPVRQAADTVTTQEECDPQYLFLSASATLDAISGQVLSVNRPVRYSSDDLNCKGYPVAGAR